MVRESERSCRERRERERERTGERERRDEREGDEREKGGSCPPLTLTARPGGLAVASLGPAPAASGGRRPGVATPATPKREREKQQGGCCPLLTPWPGRPGLAWRLSLAAAREARRLRRPGVAGAGRGGLRPPQRRRREGAAAPSTIAHRGPKGPLAAPRPPASRRRRSAPAGGAGGGRRSSSMRWSWPDLGGGRERGKWEKLDGGEER